jgi:hypothetical protein
LAALLRLLLLVVLLLENQGCHQQLLHCYCQAAAAAGQLPLAQVPSAAALRRPAVVHCRCCCCPLQVLLLA